MSYHSLFLEHCYWFFDHKVSVQSASIGEVSAYCSVKSRSRAELTWHVQSNNLKHDSWAGWSSGIYRAYVAFKSLIIHQI